MINQTLFDVNVTLLICSNVDDTCNFMISIPKCAGM